MMNQTKLKSLLYLFTFLLAFTIQLEGNMVYADLPAWRWDHAMAYDSDRGVTVLVDGYLSGGIRNGETWEWDGNTWELVHTYTEGDGPTPRGQHAMVYDSLNKVIVLFGGTDDNGFSNETWTWDGSIWVLADDGLGIAPSPRYNPAMAFNDLNGVTVLFGGYGESPNLGDTWVWNGKSWVEQFPINSPSARRGHTMVFDRSKGLTVLFGGHNSSGDLDDTWTWNGEDWVNTGYTGPSARRDHAMAYDDAKGVSVMFGGTYGDDMTWTLDPTIGWTNLGTLDPTPDGRWQSAMAYDINRSVTVMFCGYDTTENDTWEFDGENWRKRFPCTLDLSYAGECPGQIDLTISNVTPCGKIALVYGFKAGKYTVPGSICPGITLDIKPPYPNSVPLIVTDEDCDGIVTISGNVPAGACGKLLIQAVDLETCCVSNLITI